MINVRMWSISVCFSIIFSLLTCSIAISANFNSFYNDIKRKIPIAEKQAGILAKMLTIERHTVKIENDINTSLTKTIFVPIKDAYIYRVLEKLKVGLDKSRIVINLKGIRQSAQRTHIFGYLLDPTILTVIATGYFDTGYYDFATAYYNPEHGLFANDSNRKEQFERLANIIKKLLDVQMPLFELINSKLKVKDMQRNRLKMPAFSRAKAPSMQLAYRFMLPKKEYKPYAYLIYGQDERNIIRTNLEKHPSNYLKQLNRLFSHLYNIGYKFRGDRTGDKMEQISNIISTIISKRLEEQSLNLDDLTSDKNPKKQTDDDLNLDDLKLPTN